MAPRSGQSVSMRRNRRRPPDPFSRDPSVRHTKMSRSNSEQMAEVAMREAEEERISSKLSGDRKAELHSSRPMDVDEQDVPQTRNLAPGSIPLWQPRPILDLEDMAFSHDDYLLSSRTRKLPDGASLCPKDGYVDIRISVPKKTEMSSSEIVPISVLPRWAQTAFQTSTFFSEIPSKVFRIAFGQDDPILLCAPARAGKTDVVLLTVLNELAKVRDHEAGTFDLQQVKIVYLAPLNQLVREMVWKFTMRLKPLGVNTCELRSGPLFCQQHLTESHIIITTPEAWDEITRLGVEVGPVRLMIFDGLHLLHEASGPVLEAIIARTVRRMEQTNDYVRLVGLSVPSPNYEDVAAFLRVDTRKGLFYFDATHRSCGLQQRFIGVTEYNAVERSRIMNDLCYKTIFEQAAKTQTLVFVMTQEETTKTARIILNMAIEKETITQFVQPGAAGRATREQGCNNAVDQDLKYVLSLGFGIYHDGMTREDLALVRGLFHSGHIQVLICTPSFAFDSDVSAQTVIIKDPLIYYPAKGRKVVLPSRETLQILRRAGRPQSDSYSKAIVIAKHSELQYFIDLLNGKLPIESVFLAKLADSLNVEIVLGTIRNRDEAVNWLGYTYFFVRMKTDRTLYSFGAEYQDDPLLMHRRADLVHSAAVLLEKSNLVKYEQSSGKLTTTELGRISSRLHVRYESMGTFNEHLHPSMSTGQLIRVFALSDEFKRAAVQQEEKLELAELIERVPTPVKESIEEPAAKINALLQAYMSHQKIESSVLLADMSHIKQVAIHSIKVIYQMCLLRGWPGSARAALELCKMVRKGLCESMSCLRQLHRGGMPSKVIRKMEGQYKSVPLYLLLTLSPQKLSELFQLPEDGLLIHRVLRKFPKLKLAAEVQPITRSLLRIILSITPDFQWDTILHQDIETFVVLVEDVQSRTILYHETFCLRQCNAMDEHSVSFTVPMYGSTPPKCQISVISERWLHVETRIPISYGRLSLPAISPPPIALLDLQALPLSALHNKEFESIYSSTIQTFNKIQTQVFQALYTTDDNVFVGAPTGSGKTICAEFALLRLWSQIKASRAVCIEPFQEMVDLRVAEWQLKFGKLQDGKEIVSLTGEASADLLLLEKGDVIVCTPSQWDVISRRWKQRKNVQNVGLLIADEIQLVGGEIGPTYEVIISRTRYVSAQTDIKTRIVACGVTLANARDLGDWMGVPNHAVFNFPSRARPLDMDIHWQSFTTPPNFPSLMIDMSKSAYFAIMKYSPTKPVVIFVPSRKQCTLTASDIQLRCLADGNKSRFLNLEETELQKHLDHVTDRNWAESLKHGIGIYHEALDKRDKRIVERLFTAGAIQVIVASRDVAWSIPVASYMVVIMGVQYYEGKGHRYVDYPVTDVLQMIGKACRPTEEDQSRCVLMCQQTRKEFYKECLHEGLPVESHLPTSTNMLRSYFLVEITEKTIENIQGAVDTLTWTYFYKRVTQNPSYYHLSGVSILHVAAYLAELVKNTLNDLVTTKHIIIKDKMIFSASNDHEDAEAEARVHDAEPEGQPRVAGP